jgi:hypothetical protein
MHAGGALSLPQYQNFARKRSILSQPAKIIVCSMWEAYLRLKRREHMWDEGKRRMFHRRMLTPPCLAYLL